MITRALNAIIAMLGIPLLIILGCCAGFLLLCGVGYLVMCVLFRGFTGC
jgi:hypothetical protein